MLRTWFVCFSMVAGCGGGTPAPTQSTEPAPIPESAKPAPVESAPVELPPDAGPAAPTEVHINPGATKTIGDISISYFRSHKHRTDGRAAGMWRLNFEKSGDKDHMAYTGSSFYAEGVFFGALIIAEDDGEAVRVVLHQTVPTPLTEEEAKALVKKVAGERGIETDAFSSSSTNGVFSITLLSGHRNKPTAKASVGLYSKKLLSFEDVR